MAHTFAHFFLLSNPYPAMNDGSVKRLKITAMNTNMNTNMIAGGPVGPGSDNNAPMIPAPNNNIMSPKIRAKNPAYAIWDQPRYLLCCSGVKLVSYFKPAYYLSIAIATALPPPKHRRQHRDRSEERRVGKEWRSRRSTHH